MKKDQSIETLRGIAIILMVAGHVIGNDFSHGMKVADDSEFRYFYFSLQFLRMPLFTVISGFVYSLRPTNFTNTFKFLKGKARRILLPFFAVATLQFIFKCFTPGVNTPTSFVDIWKIYIFPFDQFWFLQSIFLVFLLVSFLERYNQLSEPKKYFFYLGVAITLFLFLPKSFQVFSFNGFIYLLPFFILGIGINRFHQYFEHRITKITISSLFVICIVIQQLIWFKIISNIDLNQYSLLAIIIGISGTLTLFYLRKAQVFLARLGYYSFGIYLMHVFGTASSRIIFTSIGIENSLIIFLISLTFGLGLPVVAELIIMKNKFLKLVFLGLKE